MVGGIQTKPLRVLTAALAGGFIASAHASLPFRQDQVLVNYSFDDENIVTGPSTFSVFQYSKGRVRLSRRFPLSGLFAVEIQDAALDGNFPELQGYFPSRKKGKLYIHFAFLTATPYETFNMALAGPAGFKLGKDGITFWLLSRKGYLVHYSDSIPKKLFSIKPFVWYSVDAAYDLDTGTYDLKIQEERISLPIVNIENQPSASGQRNSEINKFSFVGDVGEDTSNVDYFVDDVVIGTDEAIAKLPFVAPGRHQLFVDIFSDYEVLYRQKISCLPATDPEDFGLDTKTLEKLKQKDALGALGKIVWSAVTGAELTDLNPRDPNIEAALHWRKGCQELAANRSVEALAEFEQAERIWPRGKIVQYSKVLALTALNRWEEADRILLRIESEARFDPRYSVLLAITGTARGDLDRAEAALKPAAQEATDETLRERYFFTLLWNSKFSEAASYAQGILGLLGSDSTRRSFWLESAGDAAFYQEKIADARDYYLQAVASDDKRQSAWLKLSDVYFLLGDIKNERLYREKIYGRLAE